MAGTFTIRLTPRLKHKLTEHCAQYGVTANMVVVLALNDYLSGKVVENNAYALAANLIPKRGAIRLQSAGARKLVRSAFGRPDIR